MVTLELHAATAIEPPTLKATRVTVESVPGAALVQVADDGAVESDETV
jgi:hypothetical protein